MVVHGHLLGEKVYVIDCKSEPDVPSGSYKDFNVNIPFSGPSPSQFRARNGPKINDYVSKMAAQGLLLEEKVYLIDSKSDPGVSNVSCTDFNVNITFSRPEAPFSNRKWT